MKNMIIINYNYIAVFLTFACDNDCPYCITRLDGLVQKETIPAKNWIDLFNSMEIIGDVPLTFQGGEPTLHPEFYQIVNGIDLKNKSLNLMTNLNFDPQEFMKAVNPDIFNRKAPFPSIRVSYHIEQIERDIIIDKVKIMTDKGYGIGLYMLDHPNNQKEIKKIRKTCQKLGIDFRLKDYLDKNIEASKIRYHFNEDTLVHCRNSDLIIGPDLNVYKCHYDLYTNKVPLFNLKNSQMDSVEPIWTTCSYPTRCNPCDMKIKNDRYQQWGYCSVEIK